MFTRESSVDSINNTEKIEPDHGQNSALKLATPKETRNASDLMCDIGIK